MPKANLKIILLLLCILFASCSMSRDREIAERAVKEYHERYNNRSFSEIYDNEHEELKKAKSKEAFLRGIEALRNAKGSIKSAKMINDEYEYTSDETRVRLTYDVQFENGPAREQFIFNISGDKALLSGYKFIPSD